MVQYDSIKWGSIYGGFEKASDETCMELMESWYDRITVYAYDFSR
jgi:hypothetical protein